LMSAFGSTAEKLALSSTRIPRGMLEPPDPKTWCEIDDVHVRQFST